MPPPEGSALLRELQTLEAELKRLEAEYNLFFTGRLPRPPWETRARVDTLFKRYDRMFIQNTGDRFKFQTLQSKWASYCELWERQMQKLEMGRPRFNRNKAPLPPGAAPPAEATPPEVSQVIPLAAAQAQAQARGQASLPRSVRPQDGVVGVTSFKDPAVQGDRVQELYERLIQAKRDAGEQPVAFDKFQDLVRSQVSKLGTEGREVAFRVAFKDGKVQLTAKTVKGV
jgi:hypothetical protein